MNKKYLIRANKLQEKIKNNQSLLLSSFSNITYLTNFNFLIPEEREAFVFITKNSINLICTSFSPVDYFSHINYFEGIFPEQLANHLENITKKENIDVIQIDDETLFVSEFNAIKNKLIDIEIKIDTTNLVQNLRNIKEPTEIEKIKKACIITAKIMKNIKQELTEGMTELDVKKLLKNLFDKNGIDQLAFPTIVAFGTNSALPHHQPGNKILEANMPVLIDMGARISGYCADMTRTFWFGPHRSKKFTEIEDIVHSAYKIAYNKLKDRLDDNNNIKDILAKNIDDAARSLITKQGYSENFIHTTGHGLGLSIHEQPSISWKNETKLKPNMTITIEPGIYLEGEFGYRYENTVLITNDGANELTNL